MYCEHCGKKVNEEDKFCGSCGAPISVPTATPDRINEEIPSKLHSSLVNDTSREAQILKATEEGLGMKWYKWLIYFALFLSALTFISEGIGALTGTQYDAALNLLYGTEQSWGETIYNMYPGLSIVDKIYGAFAIGAAIFAIIMRSKLAKFKTNATSQYITYLLIIVTVGVIYTILQAVIIKSADVTLVISTVALILRYLLERKYFLKREHLFVN